MSKKQISKVPTRYDNIDMGHTWCYFRHTNPPLAHIKTHDIYASDCPRQGNNKRDVVARSTESARTKLGTVRPATCIQPDSKLQHSIQTWRMIVFALCLTRFLGSLQQHRFIPVRPVEKDSKQYSTDFPHLHLRTLPVISADNLRNICPHFTRYTQIHFLPRMRTYWSVTCSVPIQHCQVKLVTVKFSLIPMRVVSICTSGDSRSRSRLELWSNAL